MITLRYTRRARPSEVEEMANADFRAYGLTDGWQAKFLVAINPDGTTRAIVKEVRQ